MSAFVLLELKGRKMGHIPRRDDVEEKHLQSCCFPGMAPLAWGVGLAVSQNARAIMLPKGAWGSATAEPLRKTPPASHSGVATCLFFTVPSGTAFLSLPTCCPVEAPIILGAKTGWSCGHKRKILGHLSSQLLSPVWFIFLTPVNWMLTVMSMNSEYDLLSLKLDLQS